jgi:hypothetical protein
VARWAARATTRTQTGLGGRYARAEKPRSGRYRSRPCIRLGESPEEGRFQPSKDESRGNDSHMREECLRLLWGDSQCGATEAGTEKYQSRISPLGALDRHRRAGSSHERSGATSGMTCR